MARKEARTWDVDVDRRYNTNEGSTGDGNGDGSGTGSADISGDGKDDGNMNDNGEGGREGKEIGNPPYHDRSEKGGNTYGLTNSISREASCPSEYAAS